MSEQWVPILMMCSIFFRAVFVFKVFHIYDRKMMICCGCRCRADVVVGKRRTYVARYANHLAIISTCLFIRQKVVFTRSMRLLRRILWFYSRHHRPISAVVCALFIYLFFFCPFFFLFFRSVRFMFSPSQMSCARQLWNVKEDIANSTSRRLYTLHYANE